MKISLEGSILTVYAIVVKLSYGHTLTHTHTFTKCIIYTCVHDNYMTT